MRELLIKKLNNKLDKELNKYYSELLKISSKDIIGRSYETIIKEEITNLFAENCSYSTEEVEALLKLDNTLDYLFKKSMNNHNRIFGEINDCLQNDIIKLGKQYIDLKNDKDYKLILLISKLLNDFKNYKVNIKFKEDNLIDDFNEITIKDLLKKEDGIKNLIIYFQKLEYNEQLLYFSTLDVTRFNNSNLISMKILPKLYSILFEFYDNKVNNKDF